MKYNKVRKGIFIKREKRFIGYVEMDGVVNKVHVKQTGRCEELLIPGVTVFVETATNPNRKTKYTLIAVIKPNGRLINIDSQIPNKMFHEALNNGLELPGFTGPYDITPESTWGNSRFDFKLVRQSEDCNLGNNPGNKDEQNANSNHNNNNASTAYVEVKGVTLEEDGVVLFPDAPTERGLKHVNELIKAKEEGYEAFVVFVIQMEDVDYFTPNMRTHPQLGEALKVAEDMGIGVLAYDSRLSEDGIELGERVKVKL